MPRKVQHENVIEAAKKLKIKHIFYTSFVHADTTTSPLAVDHQATEKYIKASGIPYSFVRDGWYLENESFTIQNAASGKPFVFGAGKAKASWVLESELAKAIANILTFRSPKKVYELAGPPYTYLDLAKATQKASGKNFEIKDLSPKDYQKYLTDQGYDKNLVNLLTGMVPVVSSGSQEVESSDLEDALGHKLPPLSQRLKEVLKNNS